VPDAEHAVPDGWEGCGWHGCRLCYPDPMPDGGPCPLCGRQVARVLLDGHLAVHELRGDQLTGPQRVRAAIARDRGQVAPQRPVTLCGPDRPAPGGYGDNRLDWAGLSWRRLRGWFRDSQCLARCDEGHTYGRWCLLGPRRTR